MGGIFSAALAGALFGIGLILSGMTDPRKVTGFLDVAGAWDPSLALVMVGALAVGVFAFGAARRRTRAWSGTAIHLPARTAIDTRLVVGSALFGIGWGMAGFCPGPALVAIAGAGDIAGGAAVFVAAMAAGMLVHDGVAAKRRPSAPPAIDA